MKKLNESLRKQNSLAQFNAFLDTGNLDNLYVALKYAMKAENDLEKSNEIAEFLGL